MNMGSLRVDQHSIGAGLAIGLRLLGWFTVTILSTLGCVAVVAIAIGSFSFDGTMLQLSNLSSRFVAADAGRQAQFEHIVLLVFCAILTLIAFFRRASMIAAIYSEKGQ